MSYYLSKTKIEAFCGQVLPLQVLGIGDPEKETVIWQAEGEAVRLRDFAASEEFPFTYGVLVTAVQEGEGVIKARCGEVSLSCSVQVRKRAEAEPGKPYRHYIGDLHIHSTMEHNHEQFAVRTREFPYEFLEQIHRDGILDFCVVSDHGDTLNDKDFFRSFTDAEPFSEEELVIFPGAESEVTCIETDRYGYSHKNSGEIVTLNANQYAATTTWEAFLERFEDSPEGFAVLAHPHVVGYDQNGIWNFSLQKNQFPELKKLVKLVEMGNGQIVSENMIYEQYYSVALDCGYRVAPCCDSDSHAAYQYCSGKTVIMARGKSKELFLDAILKHRVYATESGLVELNFTVNGCEAGETLPLTDTYRFQIQTALRGEALWAKPVKCEVITDYGWKIKTVDLKGRDQAEFEVASESARYFYLRLVDEKGYKTWSAPVWTGRAFDRMEELADLKVLDKTAFTAWDEVAGADGKALIDEDPRSCYRSEHQRASIVIDMKQMHRICAVGHITPVLLRDEVKRLGLSIVDTVSAFVGDCRISVSADGISYQECVSGSVRVFGGEDIFRFSPVDARYVKFEVLSTVGKNSDKPEYAGAGISMAELTVFC